MQSLSILQFNNLADFEKKKMLAGSVKLSEHKKGNRKFELFKINNFYVEVITTFAFKTYRQIKSYEYNNVPFVYKADILQATATTAKIYSPRFLAEYLH